MRSGYLSDPTKMILVSAEGTQTAEGSVHYLDPELGLYIRSVFLLGDAAGR